MAGPLCFVAIGDYIHMLGACWANFQPLKKKRLPSAIPCGIAVFLTLGTRSAGLPLCRSPALPVKRSAGMVLWVDLAGTVAIFWSPTAMAA